MAPVIVPSGLERGATIVCRLPAMMLHDPVRRSAALLVAAVLAVPFLPGLVLAHAELVTPSPADRSTATGSVAVVSGIYSEAMKRAGSSLVVKDATGVTVAKGTVDPADDTRMVATPTAPLVSGAYDVEWTAVATDGHVERGRWTFKVAVAATPSPTPVPTAVPSAAPTIQPTAAATPVAITPAPTPGPTPAPTASGGSSGSGADVLLSIIVALIVLSGGAAYLLTRRNRPPDPT
jgi:hypothetical protein